MTPPLACSRASGLAETRPDSGSDSGPNRAPERPRRPITTFFSGPFEHARAIFAAFDHKDIEALSALMTDDVRLQIGNTDVVTGKAAFEQSLIACFDSVASFRHKIVEVWSDGEP